MTMTDQATRRRLVDLSVIAMSSLALGGAFLVVARVDRDRQDQRAMTEVAAGVSQAAMPVLTAETGPPVPGLVPAPRAVRRVVVVRRSRAS
jgi:hypothetical protein